MSKELEKTLSEIIDFVNKDVEILKNVFNTILKKIGVK